MAQQPHSCGPGCGHDHTDFPANRGAEYLLYKNIDTERVTAFNATGPANVIFKPWDQRFDTSRFVETNNDNPQLIIHIPFTGTVKLKSFILIPGEGGTCPTHVRVHINRDDVDFTNASRVKPLQEWDLVEDRRGDVEYPTKITKFNSVHSLTMHFDRNAGAPSSRIYFLALKGDFTPSSRNPVITAYELFPQPKNTKTPSEQGNISRLGM